MSQEGTTTVGATHEDVISEGTPEQESEPLVLEDSEEEEKRKALLEQRIQEQV